MRYEQQSPQKSLNATGKKIVDAAEVLFLEKGYKDVTVREIAEAAGANVGLIPYYFGSKENLATHVTRRLNDKWYNQVFETTVPDMGSAERLYIYTVLLWDAMDEQSSRFVFEFMENCPAGAQASTTFVDMSWTVIRDHHLTITPAQNDAYITAMKGAEYALVMRKQRNDLNITYEEITNIILSDYFYNIGLSDKTIAGIMTRSSSFLHKRNN